MGIMITGLCETRTTIALESISNLEACNLHDDVPRHRLHRHIAVAVLLLLLKCART
jgi:hypothetical protein